MQAHSSPKKRHGQHGKSFVSFPHLPGRKLRGRGDSKGLLALNGRRKEAKNMGLFSGKASSCSPTTPAQQPRMKLSFSGFRLPFFSRSCGIKHTLLPPLLVSSLHRFLLEDCWPRDYRASWQTMDHCCSGPSSVIVSIAGPKNRPRTKDPPGRREAPISPSRPSQQWRQRHLTRCSSLFATSDVCQVLGSIQTHYNLRQP